MVYIACNTHATYFKSGDFPVYDYHLFPLSLWSSDYFDSGLVDYMSSSGPSIDSYNREWFNPGDPWYKFDGRWGSKFDSIPYLWHTPGSPGSTETHGRRTRSRFGFSHYSLHYQPKECHNLWVDNPHNNWSGDESLKISR